MLCDSCSVLLEQPVIMYEAIGKRGRATFVVCADCRRLLRQGIEIDLTLHYEGEDDRQPFSRQTPKVQCDGCGRQRMDVSRWEVDGGGWSMVCDDCEEKLYDEEEIVVMVHFTGKPDERTLITQK